MAVQKEPILKKCRYLGISPAVMGVSKKESIRFKNAANRKKISEYGLQLKEKQKLKFIYGVLEKQFRNLLNKFQHLSQALFKESQMVLGKSWKLVKMLFQVCGKV